MNIQVLGSLGSRGIRIEACSRSFALKAALVGFEGCVASKSFERSQGLRSPKINTPINPFKDFCGGSFPKSLEEHTRKVKQEYSRHSKHSNMSRGTPSKNSFHITPLLPP